MNCFRCLFNQPLTNGEIKWIIIQKNKTIRIGPQERIWTRVRINRIRRIKNRITITIADCNYLVDWSEIITSLDIFGKTMLTSICNWGSVARWTTGPNKWTLVPTNCPAELPVFEADWTAKESWQGCGGSLTRLRNWFDRLFRICTYRSSVSWVLGNSVKGNKDQPIQAHRRRRTPFSPLSYYYYIYYYSYYSRSHDQHSTFIIVILYN